MASQFDEFAKNLASNMSRREALRRFGMGLLGTLLAALGLGALIPLEARAQNSNCFYFCKAIYPNDSNAQAACQASGGLCSQCGPAASPPRRALCNAPGSNAFCCPSGQGCCNGTSCVSLQNSLSNCGACGRVCGTGFNTCCAGACTNTNTDANNCGTCGNFCSRGTCTGGVCICKSAGTTCGSTSECCSGLTCPSGSCCFPSRAKCGTASDDPGCNYCCSGGGISGCDGGGCYCA